MRIFASWSRHLALLVLAYTFQSGGFENGNFAPAQAQTVPKSLEQGGSDAALRNRINNWTVGIAGGQLSGTYMTFANEMAEVRPKPSSSFALLTSVDRSSRIHVDGK
jgi:hypothetical protein